MITEARKQYLKDYRKKNRGRIRDYFRNYYKENVGVVPSLSNRTRGIKGKNSMCALGRKYEKLALSLLRGSKDMNSKSFAGPYDIEWKSMKIEVKMRNRNKQGYWNFTFTGTCGATHALLFCVDRGISRVLLVPYGGQLNIHISNTNKKEFEILLPNEELLK